MKRNLWLLVSSLGFINNNFIAINKSEFTQSNVIELYFNPDHSSKTIYASYARDDEYYFGIFNYDLGNKIPIYFQKVKLLGKEDCYTKTSWGDTPYYGTELWKKIDNKNFLDLAVNSQVTDKKINVFLKYADITLLDINEYFMAAFIISKQLIGFTWYYNNQNHNFYLQIIVYYYTRVWGSASNGGRWLNIGKGLEITFNQS